MWDYSTVVRDSYSIDLASLAQNEKTLWESLPEDYKMFLASHNGGFLETEETFFYTNIPRFFGGRTYNDSGASLEELWGFISHENSAPEDDKPASFLHEHFDRHVDEGFLPQGVYAIGRCAQNSLVCISTNASDFGSIYYWEWYWRYPWFIEYFEERIGEAAAAFDDAQAILDDPLHVEHQKVMDVVNYTTLVKVADSFTTFWDNLIKEPTGEGA